MPAGSQETIIPSDPGFSVPEDALNFWANIAVPTQQSLGAGEHLWSVSSIPDLASLRITKPLQNVPPPIRQKPMSSGIADSSPSTPELETETPHSFDTVFQSLSCGAGFSELSNNEIIDQVFEEVLTAGVNLANDIFDLCESLSQQTTGDSSTIDTLLEEAEELCAFRPYSEKVIALLGRSGEGKSSLINSLLGFNDLAPTGDIGSACTSIVTEFRQKDDRHKSEITLEIEYYTMEETEELLADLVINFRKVHLIPKVESAEDKAARPRDEQSAENQSTEAWSALQAAFGHHKRFGRPFLLDQSPGAMDRITSQLIQWATLLEWPKEATDGKYCVAVDQEDCAAKISHFMGDKFWPFTKIIRRFAWLIFLDSEILKSGVVLTDLPGRSDTNTARIKAGQMYLQRCDRVFILSNISRAVTDASLKSSVYEMLHRQMPIEWEMNRGKNLQITVICTKTDEINIPANKRALIPESGSDFKYCVKELEMAIKKAANGETGKALEKKMKNLFIKARNNSVGSKLRRGYQLENPTGQISVFCVSSKMYGKSLKRDRADEMLELSGIPMLRKFCRSLNRSDRHAEILNFVQSRLPGLLNTLDLCSNTTESRMDVQTAAEVWKDTQGKINYNVVSAGDGLRDECLKPVLDYFEHRADHWESAALEESEKWLSWHHTQYNAFCQNYGDHATAKIKPTNWNQSIIWKMAQELTHPLEQMEEDAQEQTEKLLNGVQHEINDLKKTYEEAGVPPEVLVGLDLHVGQLIYQIRLTQHNIKRKIVRLRRSILEANRASYVVRNMMPAYLSAIDQRFGPGRKVRQQTTIQRWIKSQIFPAMQREVEEHSSQLFETSISELRKELKYIFRLIRTGIEAGLVPPEEYQQVEMPGSFGARAEHLLKVHEQIAGQIAAVATVPQNTSTSVAFQERRTNGFGMQL